MARGLGDFIGTYGVSRVIEDARSGATSRFDGSAVIAPDGAGALYTETGTLTLNDQCFQAERSYLWRPTAERIEVLFADGRAFHNFDPEDGGNATEHQCGEDTYRGGYEFTEWSCWAVTWDVHGPRKDYKSVTWYVRR